MEIPQKNYPFLPKNLQNPKNNQNFRRNFLLPLKNKPKYVPKYISPQKIRQNLKINRFPRKFLLNFRKKRRKFNPNIRFFPFPHKLPHKTIPPIIIRIIIIGVPNSVEKTKKILEYNLFHKKPRHHLKKRF